MEVESGKMTLAGAIKQLHELRSAEDMPIYYKPAIAEVINVLLMDAQEVRHGQWEIKPLWQGAEAKYCECSVCHHASWMTSDYCQHCGAKMDEVEDGKI